MLQCEVLRQAKGRSRGPRPPLLAGGLAPAKTFGLAEDLTLKHC
jgi:hypothetical protein